jgi:hypothetical protein
MGSAVYRFEGEMSDRNRRAASADLIREVNDQIRDLAGQFGEEISGKFVCECDDPDCMERVALPLDDFDARRRSTNESRILAH